VTSSSERFTVGIDCSTLSTRAVVGRARDGAEVGVERADFAEMARTGLVVIDESTTLAHLQRELRWSQAHHRLAQGL